MKLFQGAKGRKGWKAHHIGACWRNMFERCGAGQAEVVNNFSETSVCCSFQRSASLPFELPLPCPYRILSQRATPGAVRSWCVPTGLTCGAPCEQKCLAYSFTE